MAKKDDRQEALTFIEPHLQDWLARSKDRNTAFRDWATEQVLSQALSDFDLSESDIQAITSVDGAGGGLGDLGIDGWYLADREVPSTLFIIQSKNTKAKGEDLSYLKDSLERALHPASGGDANLSLKDAVAELMANFPDDLTVEFHFVTSDFANATIRNQAEALSATPLQLPGRPPIPCKMVVHDIRDLVDGLRPRLQEPISAKLSFRKGEFMGYTAGGFPAYTVVVPTIELATLFGDYKVELFRLNPRYYQSASTGTNKDIRGTLRGADRDKFILLNNGVTAIADKVVVDQAGTSLTAANFQIVNGCQTTATLHSVYAAKGGGEAALSGVTVLLRIIQSNSPAIAESIARSTNTQNPIKAQDYRANDDRQKLLQVGFENLKPRWYYEIKRGVWARGFKDASEKARYTGLESDVPRLRKVGLNDLAQACLAFAGEPADASDRVRAVFALPTEGEKENKTYEKTFPAKIVAVQLLLPYLLYSYADTTVQSVRAEHPEALYLRYPLVTMTSRFIHEVLRIPNDTYLSVEQSQTLTDTIHRWGPRLFEDARSTLAEYVRVKSIPVKDEETGKETAGIGVRSLARKHGWIGEPYALFLRKISDQLQMAADFAAENGVPLESVKGLHQLFPYPIKI